MTALVDFLVVNNTQSGDNDWFAYTKNIINNLLDKKLITQLVTNQSSLDFASSSPIMSIEENIFIINFIYSKDGHDTHWKLEFEFGTFNSSNQLQITIYSNDYKLGINDNYLEQLKLFIKKIIKSDWEKIVWLMDKDSEMLSIELYPSIYRVENLARQLINEVMIKEYGIEWWNVYVPAYIRDKHRSRLRGYKSVVPGFANVDERLMSIDIGDLISIFMLQEKKWKPIFNNEVSQLLNGHSEIKLEKLKKILSEQMHTTKDLWTDQFSKYLSNSFIENLKEFELNRNHVVHNKLIDRAAYTTILSSIHTVEEELKFGLKKVSEHIISSEQRGIISEQLEMERQEQEAALHEIMVSEAGVEIRSSEEILDLFDEYLYNFHSEFQANLRFRNDIEISDYQNIISSSDIGILFEVKYKINDEIAIVSYSIESITESQGDESSINILVQLGKESYSKQIRYINGEVSFNSYQGNYMPERQDEFYISDVDELTEGLMDFIETHFENMRECIDSEMFSIIKDGGQNPLAEIPCWECGEDYICVDENYGIFGQCLNCGEMNEIAICSRCECLFEGNSNEEEPVFCDNCLDYFESQ
ncbi:hypothetical protein [Tissierella creatinophila]|uniref:Apea-like HEPN domain-containing protein n=1 Tax=Tissierella creatinophila DSM 6911 TaxID=1123403 RepID=A0A1U7M3S5_TISCR|nr:hypothetical protein [Tissierella creatinophila]OLS01935.1 hypothetical protein TICRE_20770 [Tissierella creatinophila DSM 6911]